MDVDPVAVARSLQPLIRQHADDGERARCPPEPVIRTMARSGLFRLGAPADYGGLEADPVTLLEVTEVVSEADGAIGWTLMVGLEAGLLLAAMQPGAAAALSSAHPDLVMCGAFNPLGRAREVEGGVVVSGRWPYVSGCTVADYFCGGCLLVDDQGARLPGPSMRQVVVPLGDCVVEETWDSLGLAASGSHDVVLSQVFVPNDRVTDVYGTGMRVDGALYRLPLPSRLAMSKVGVATGIARSVLTMFVELAAVKVPTATNVPLRERAHVQLAMAEAEARLRASRAFVVEAATSVWAATRNGQDVTSQERALLRLACAHCCREAVAAVDLVASEAGMTASTGPRAFTRAIRDIRVVPQHFWVAPAAISDAGRVLLGFDPISPI